jgi:YebC/PmpR family DNA-binding regulatory protein
MGRAFEYRRAAKEKRWDKMSRIFPKLAKAITIAAKEGGSDPEMNASLRTAIQNAKGQNMPKDNIEAAIKRASSKDLENFSEINYDGKGPHGSLVFVEAATDNPNRTVANIKVYLTRSGGSLAPTGSLEFMFNRKAVFEFPQGELNIEELELELIDHGLEEIELNEETFYAYADFKEFGSMSKALEGMNIEVSKATLQRIPTDAKEFSEEQMEDIEKMLDKIEEDDDVQAVYTNLA